MIVPYQKHLILSLESSLRSEIQQRINVSHAEPLCRIALSVQQEVLPKRLLIVQIQGEKDSPVFPAGSYVL